MSLCVCRTVASVFIPADDQRFTYMGRVSFDQVEGAVAWTYPGVQIQAVFTGTSISMKTNPGSGFYIINIDDRPSFKLESGKEEEVMTLATGLANRDHRLTITYAIEGHAKKPVFYGLYLDDGCTLKNKPVLLYEVTFSSSNLSTLVEYSFASSVSSIDRTNGMEELIIVLASALPYTSSSFAFC